jgi:hypothetical protein
MRFFAIDETVFDLPDRNGEAEADARYHELWMAVIKEAIAEVTLGPIRPKWQDWYGAATEACKQHYEDVCRANHKAYMTYWLDWIESNDFTKVCEFAGMDPDIVHKHICDTMDLKAGRFINNVRATFSKTLTKKRKDAKKSVY